MNYLKLELGLGLNISIDTSNLQFHFVSSTNPQAMFEPRVSQQPESEAPQCWAPVWTSSYRHQLSPHQLSWYLLQTPSLISWGWRVRRPTITMSHNVRWIICEFLWSFRSCSNDHMFTFSLNVLCFPFTIGKVKITVFHLLVACTFVFTYLWGYVIYNMLIKDNQVSRP